MLHQADIKTRRNLVLATGDPAGSIVSTGGVLAGSIPTGSVPASHVLTSSVPAGSVPASHVPAGSVPASHVPASSIPAGGVLAGSIDSARFGDPAVSESVLAIFTTDHAATSILPPEPSSVAKALEDPDWVAAMQEEMQQFYNQQEGIDYDEVFAPVARIEAIRLFLAFASHMGFMVYQMDVKSAFLCGEIEEKVYVTQPKVFEDPHNPKHVYRVVKALYGLHQAPRAWYARLSTFLLKHHYRRGTINKTLFLKKDSRNIILIQVYVDDIIFGSTNQAWCDEFEVLMKGEFEMSAMGELTFFLALQVKQLPGGIFIRQDKYVKDMLKKFNIESVRTTTTPYEVPKRKLKDESDDAVNLEAYNDSDYAGSHGDRKSITGGCQFLGRRLKSWQCKKQTVVATSSTKAEYVAAASCCGQISLSGSPHWDAQSLATGIGGRNKPKGRLTIVYSVYTNFCAGRPPILLVVPVFLLVVLVHADGWVSAGRCTIPTSSYTIPTGSCTIPTGSGTIPTDSGTIPTSSCSLPTGGYLFMLLDWFLLFWATATVRTLEARPSEIIATTDGSEDGLPMPLLAPMLVVPASGNGVDAAAAEEVGPTTSTKPPSPTRQTSFQEDVSEGGGDYVSSPKSDDAPPTTAATAAGGAEDSAALTASSLKLDRCINRVTSLENELGVTKKVLGGVVLKLATRVKRLEGLLQQRKRRLDAGHNEDEVLADTTMPFRRTRTTRRRLMKTVTSLAFEHFQENISAGEDTILADAYTIPAGSTPIPSSGGVSAGSSMDPADQATAAAPSSTIPVADKGKAPMVDDSLPDDLLSEQERILKNLHDYQLGEDLAKKLHAKQEAEFTRKQEELA
nr:copia protein [Tanacetum cinerariifolium]